MVRRVYADFDTTTNYVVATPQYPELVVAATDSVYLRHLSRADSLGRAVYYPVGRLLEPPLQPVVLKEEYRDGMGSGLR